MIPAPFTNLKNIEKSPIYKKMGDFFCNEILEKIRYEYGMEIIKGEQFK